MDVPPPQPPHVKGLWPFQLIRARCLRRGLFGGHGVTCAWTLRCSRFSYSVFPKVGALMFAGPYAVAYALIHPHPRLVCIYAYVYVRENLENHEMQDLCV